MVDVGGCSFYIRLRVLSNSNVHGYLGVLPFTNGESLVATSDGLGFRIRFGRDTIAALVTAMRLSTVGRNDS